MAGVTPASRRMTPALGFQYPSVGFYAALAAGWAVFSLGSLGLGRRLLRVLGFTELPLRLDCLFGLGLGLALLSYAVFTAAALQLLSYGFLAVLATLWTAAGVLNVGLPLRYLAPRRRRYRVLEGVCILILVGGAILNLFPALTPAVDWDGVAYHLALPKIYLQAGGFVFRPDIFHNLFPQFTEMLYLLALPFPYGIAAKLVHWSFGLLAAAGVYVACRQAGLRSSAWLGAAIFYSQFLVHIESGTAFIDLASAAYFGLAMAACLEALRPDAPARWLYLALFFSGVCAATKWHGLIILALLGALVLLKIWNKAGTSAEKASRSLSAVAWGSLPVLPYVLRAWIQGGNPVWPLGYSLFGGRGWNAEIADRVAKFHQAYAGMRHDFVGFLRLPLDLIAYGSRFGVGGPEQHWPIIGLLLLCAVWAYFRYVRKAALSPGWPTSRLLILAAAIMAFMAVWFVSSPQVRFLLVLFPLFAWLAAVALAGLWRTPGYGRAAAVLCAALLFTVHPPVHRNTAYQFRTLLGRVPPGEYVSRYLEHYPACEFLNRQAKPGERVLLFGENRGFYLDADYLWGDPMMQAAAVDYRALKTPEALAQRLGNLNVRWVLVRKGLYGPEYLEPGMAERMEAMLRQGGSLAFGTQVLGVYKLPLPGDEAKPLDVK